MYIEIYTKILGTFRVYIELNQDMYTIFEKRQYQEPGHGFKNSD